METERLTREEWEAREAAEQAASRSKFASEGGVMGSVAVHGADIQQNSRDGVESLIDAKLKNLKLSLLRKIYEDA